MADGKVTIDSELNDKGLEKGLSNMQKKLEGAGKKLQSVGGSLTKNLTLPIVAAGTGALLMASKFDDSMRNVKATMGKNLGDSTKEADANFKALREEAMKLGATTAHSASDASGAMKELAQMGYDTNQILASTGTVLDVASASGLELDFVATTLAGSMNQFGVEVDDNGVNVKRFGDVMVRAGQMSGTSMEEIAHALEYVGSGANKAGMDIEQTAAYIGILGDQSIKGGKAGTALSAMLRDMQSKVKDGNLEFGEFNVAMYDSQGNMRDMTDIMVDLEKGLEGMNDEQRDAAIASVFGSQAQTALNAILGEGTDKVIEYENELKLANDTAKIAAGEMEGGIGGALRGLASATEALAIAFGDVLAPYVQKVAQFVANLFLKFTELSDGMKEKIVIVGAVIAAIGPLLTVIGTIIIVVSKVMGVLAAINPVVLIVIGVIAALVAIGVALYKNWETIKEKAIEVFTMFEPLFEAVREAFSTVVEFIMDIWNQLVEFWMEHSEMLREATMNVFNVISTIIETAMNVILSIMEFIWPFIQMLIVDTWNAIKNVIQGAIDVILGIVQAFGALFTGNWSALWDAIKQVLSGAVQAIWGLINLWFVGKILKVGKSFAKLFSNLFTSLWATIRGVFTSSVGAVRNVVTGGFNAIRSVVSSVMNAIRSVISSIWNGIRSTISNILNGIKSTVSSVVNSIRSTISNIFNSLSGIVTSAFGRVRSAVSTGIKGALKVVTNMVKSFFNAGKNIVGAIADGIKSAIGKVTGAIGDVASKVRNFLPFSPAKEGPLMDIDKLNFKGPIGDSIDDAIPDVQAQMNTMLQVPNKEHTGQKKPKPVKAQPDNQMSEFVKAVDKIASRPISVQVDGDEIVRATIDKTDSALANKVDLRSFMRGGR